MIQAYNTPKGRWWYEEVKNYFFILIIFGLFLSVGGAFICVNAFDYSGKAETTAVITDFESYRDAEGSTRYKTHLTYEVDGESYNNIVKMYSSSWNVGEEIEIYYDIDNPQNIGSKHTDLALLVIPCLGLLFFSSGTILMLITHKKRKNA